MASPAQPEPKPSGEPQKPSPTPTNPPGGGATDDPKPTSGPYDKLSPDQMRRMLELQQATIRETGGKLTEATTELQGLKARMDKLEAPPKPTIDDENKEFFKNPAGIQKRQLDALREDLQTSIQPLRDFVKEMKGGTQLEKIKSKFRADPRYAKVLDGGAMEAYVDQALQNQSEINEATVMSAVFAVAGMASTGALEVPEVKPAEPKPNPNPNPAPAAGGDSPSLRPSSPPAPTPTQPEGKKRELTETEKRLARAYGQSDEEYLAGLEGVFQPEKILAEEAAAKAAKEGAK